jgi:hypothetical protein
MIQFGHSISTCHGHIGSSRSSSSSSSSGVSNSKLEKKSPNLQQIWEHAETCLNKEEGTSTGLLKATSSVY